jgi:hypothetical protein
MTLRIMVYHTSFTDMLSTPVHQTLLYRQYAHCYTFAHLLCVLMLLCVTLCVVLVCITTAAALDCAVPD